MSNSHHDSAHIEEGNIVVVTTIDDRRWKRAIHWLLRRPPPVRQRRLRVVTHTHHNLRDWLLDAN